MSAYPIQLNKHQLNEKRVKTTIRTVQELVEGKTQPRRGICNVVDATDTLVFALRHLAEYSDYSKPAGQ